MVNTATTVRRRLAPAQPASFVAFDVLAVADVDVRPMGWGVRRQRVELLGKRWAPPLQVSPVTADVGEAREWLDAFKSCGVERLVVKGASTRYQPGRRDWVKVNSVGAIVFGLADGHPQRGRQQLGVDWLCTVTVGHRWGRPVRPFEPGPRHDADACEGWLARARKLIAVARREAAEASAVTPNAAGWLALAEAEYSRTHDIAQPDPWSAEAEPSNRRQRPEETLGLSAREADVLALLARGYTNREIAAELVISVRTAGVHVSHILRKLGVPNRIEAAAIAHRVSGSR
jgi:DNA-binding CsgD family transcriptional regulator